MMDCCSVNGLAEEFNRSYVQGELRAYRRKGLDKRARTLVEFLQAQGLQGRNLLEGGYGIGALHLELLRAGAAWVVGVDVSPFSREAATELAEEMGLQDRVEHRVGDFVALEGEVAPADIVLLDRVICCYPDATALVSASASHARLFYGLTYPRNVWWIRWGVVAMRAFLALRRSAYRPFLHPPEKVKAIVASLGFGEVFRSRSGLWDIVVFRRQAAPGA
ncbi:MAG: methyltransferase domain-containing protein [Chloroflexi bacterium]|nr:methyltransferase domain-containing protein [Chloroflexota bacterium]